MVYYFAWQPDALPVLPEDWQKYLSPQRLEKALAYKNEKDKIASVYAFLLLRYALYKEYGITEMPDIYTDENGKPQEKNGRYHFNISHCATGVACAVDTTCIGVDVQEFRPVRQAVIRKVCSSNEAKLLTDSADPAKLFAAMWAGKEAYGKYTGEGIGYAMNEKSFCADGVLPSVAFEGNCMVQTDMHENFALSVCSRFEMQMQEIKERDLQLFLHLL